MCFVVYSFVVVSATVAMDSAPSSPFATWEKSEPDVMVVRDQEAFSMVQIYNDSAESVQTVE